METKTQTSHTIQTLDDLAKLVDYSLMKSMEIEEQYYRLKLSELFKL